MKKITLLIFATIFSMQLDAQTITLASDSKKSVNPLLSEWKTPYQTPPFNQIKTEHYLPAFTACINLAKKDIETIDKNPEAPTFQNTIVALDRAGQKLTRISGIFFNILECDATPDMQKIAADIQPLLTEYSNSIYLDEILFNKVKTVYEKEYSELKDVDKMLLKNTYDAFLDNGANLPKDKKEEFKRLSIELSGLTLQFGQNALAATNAWQKVITDKAELTGIPNGDLEIAKQKAEAKGLKGYLFDLSYPSRRAILTYADNQKLRKEMYMHSCDIAYGGEFDNSVIIQKILSCRQQIAQLLGYKNYAEYVLHNRMAKDCEQVYKLLDELSKYSIPAAQKEMKALTEYAHKNGLKGDLQRWDYSYYSEKQKNELFKLSDEELKPYFKLENVIDGVFSLAKNLYGLRFVANKNIDVYHKDVTVYEVYKGDEFLAVLYLDFHPRDTKRSGAWMTSFREQYVNEKGEDIRPLVSLVMNFTPSTPTQPSLLTFDEVTTFLHEFGHALNGMMSHVPYQSLSGTNSQHDFVELPSQLNENWATEYDFLKTFARHYKTGELIPRKYVDQLTNMRKYMAGYASSRQLSFGYLDMMWHTCDINEINDIRAEEQKVFSKFETMPVVKEACMSTSFSHIFAGGYAAGYYGYKWAEMLEADAFSLFKEKGVMSKEVANKYVNTILSQGGSKPAMEMFKDFRGREPRIDALLERDGLK